MVFFKSKASSDAPKNIDAEGPSDAVQGHVRSKEERSLVFRLDCFLMFFGCISQIIKYLDQVGISQPRVVAIVLTVIMNSKISVRLMFLG